MTSIKACLGTLVLGFGLVAAAHGQGQGNSNADDADNGQSDEQLAQRFSQLDSNGDGMLSLEEFQQIRGLNRGEGQDRGERMGQMTQEQREQMRERMQNMTPEQRERMREQMRERRGSSGQQDQAGAGHGHDHDEP